jgi:hypothetical protein
MSRQIDIDWQKEFGIENAGGNTFFASKEDLNAADREASQSHVLRRAFDLLKLDGILCTQNIPLVYFKQMKKIEVAEVVKLHRKFWNHGGAPILVLVSPLDVHVYSGFVRPVSESKSVDSMPGLVKTIQRATATLKEFLPSVESGEFFRRHQISFNPEFRVDRDLLDNLQATREALLAVSVGNLDERILDALLCRLVFACYLFDRGVVGESYLESIGLDKATHLRDVLALQPQSRAKTALYQLFEKLGHDFNGDLFSDDLRVEEQQVAAEYIGPLDAFFHATDVTTGQRSFWPYDFGVIPVEAISAIYERFLKAEKKDGAFYTPRFLAELVLDLALAKTPVLLDCRYLDPACGSGIFLVGLFNRIAEEWKQANPDARNDRRARELRRVLCENLYGIDKNSTACRITAFSLYLAYLDQLSPRDINELQQKGHKLPTLVHYPNAISGREVEGNIWCGDFFADAVKYPVDADLVIGNPPWGSTAVPGTAAAKWCADPEHQYPIPDKQIAAAFIGKAAFHAVEGGKVCFVLPHGTLFNQSKPALAFQRAFLKKHAVDCVLNLADYQRFLFEESEHPALVIAYQKQPPPTLRHTIDYWTPKTSWLVTKAEVIAIMPEDRSTVTVGEVLRDLEGPDAPQIWKQRYWATARDWRLLERLAEYSRLRERVHLTTDKNSKKPWLIAEGFQPMGRGDNPSKAKKINLPSRLFIKATSQKLDLFLLADECSSLTSAETVTRRKIRGTDAFRAPHVLVSQGFTSIAYADCDVSFQHALRGIAGPKQDRQLLVFLAAYLRSSIAKYFLFHTSSNWGVGRQRVGVDELLRLPFPMPEETASPKRAHQIVAEVDHIVTTAMSAATDEFVDRKELVNRATEALEVLVEEYFDIIPEEKALADDTVRIIAPSARPTRKRLLVPTIEPSKEEQRDDYTSTLCDTLNSWATTSPVLVHGFATVSHEFGIGIAVLEKTRRNAGLRKNPEEFQEVFAAMKELRDAASQKLNTFELVRGAKVFDRNRLYLIKPIGQRFWTKTAALNDADEIAGTLLMHVREGAAW